MEGFTGGTLTRGNTGLWANRRCACARGTPQAVLEIVKLSGIKLSKSDKPETIKKLDKVMKELERLHNDKSNGISTRVRLAIREILELRKSNWVPRREMYTAKKLDDVRAQVRMQAVAGSGSTIRRWEQKQGTQGSPTFSILSCRI